MEMICVKLAETGHLRALSWLANEDSSILCYNPITYFTERSEDRHEFAQPTELWGLAEVEEKREYTTLTSSAAHGNSFSFQLMPLAVNFVMSMVQFLPHSQRKERNHVPCRTSLLSYIETARESGETSDELKCLLQYKLELLQDNDSLEVRLKVLDYLVKEMEQSPPSIVHEAPAGFVDGRL